MNFRTTNQLLRSASYFPLADFAKSVDHYERVLADRPELRLP